ncbi:unnamed protein product, partial [Ascophyllum nodosum]
MLIRQVTSELLPWQKRLTTLWVFFPHAVLLCQTFAHCRKFPTASSRGSLDRVSVPTQAFSLGELLLSLLLMICGMSSHCSLLKVNSHVLLTRPPLKLKTFIRLACVKHTASVHPEPGSS